MTSVGDRSEMPAVKLSCAESLNLITRTHVRLLKKTSNTAASVLHQLSLHKFKIYH